MALNFPPVDGADDRPTDGLIWTAPDGHQWKYDASVPGWRTLAPTGNSNIVYRGGIRLDQTPESQFNDIASGNEFSVRGNWRPVDSGYYPGLEGDDVLENQLIRFDGNRWYEIGQAFPRATEDDMGVVYLATEEEAKNTATGNYNNTKAMTPKRVSQSINAHVVQATKTVVGKTRYATQAEAEAGDEIEAALTPASIKSILLQIEKNINRSAPTGMICWFAANRDPIGWVKCDGRRIYPDGDTFDLYFYLRDAKDDPWSTGSDVVRVPDLRGRFIRGYNDDTDRNPDEPGFGGYQNDMFQEHSHNVTDDGHDHTTRGYKYREGNDRSTDKLIVENEWGPYTSGDDQYREDEGGTNKAFVRIQINETGGVETRPKNLNLCPCIKL